jgi:beta-lactamase superfamily II metal-dependent hydrolase
VPLERLSSGACVLRGAGGSLVVLEDDGPPGASSNNRSAVLLLESGGCRVLLPADREEAGLRHLLAEEVPRCALLVAPHHGARCREAKRLGRAVRPECLLVSGGAESSDPATLERYGARVVLRTEESGCVTVRFPGEGRYVVESHRPRDP